MSIFCATVLASAALADGAAPSARLVPDDPIVADGQTVELALITDDPRAPTVRATEGQVLGVVPLAAHGFRLRYRAPVTDRPTPDELTVAYGGRIARRLTLPLRAAGRVSLSITVAGNGLVLGPKAATDVTITVRDAAGQPTATALRLGASVGQLSPPVATAPGQYVARYTPPSDRFPQVAILVALSVTDGAFAALPLPLSAPVRVDGRGEPNASMTIHVNGRSFGPTTIDANGVFALPILVPPGGHALGRSVDVAGNTVEREIDLHLPPFPRVLLATIPGELPADGRAHAEVVAFAVDPRGKPTTLTRATLSTDVGTLGVARVDKSGATTWTFTAPSTTRQAHDHAVLQLGEAHAEIALAPTPPFTLDVAPSTTLIAGRATLGAAMVTVTDASGAPLSGATLSAQVSGGRVLGVSESAPGRYVVDVTAPVDAGSGHVTLSVALERLRAGAPRRLSLHRLARAGVEAWVDDDLGLPVAGALVRLFVDGVASKRVATDRFGTAQLLPSPRPTTVIAELDELPGAPARIDFTDAGMLASHPGRGLDRDESSGWNGATATCDLTVAPAQPAELDLTVTRAAGHFRIDVVAHDDAGEPLAGPLLYDASGGALAEERPLLNGHARLQFSPPGPGHYVVSVTDPQSRVSSFVEVDVP